MFLAVLCLAGLVVLLQLNWFTIALGAASLAADRRLSVLKRFTFWPQAVLGLTFKWGALVGWAAVTGSLSCRRWRSTRGCVLWTIGYDTIYAHQDKEDDALLGLKSTALRFGEATPRWLAGFYAGAIVLWGAAGAMAGALAVFLALALVAVQLAWQIARSIWPIRQLPRPLQVQSAGGLAVARRACGRHGARALPDAHIEQGRAAAT